MKKSLTMPLMMSFFPIIMSATEMGDSIDTLNAVKGFYDQHYIKYYDARWQFYKNNGIIYQWRPW